MTGTTNVVRIFGSTYGDYGIQPDGDDHSPFAGAPCVDKWDMFTPDGTINPGDPLALQLAEDCATCPALELCRERARDTDAQYGYHGFWAGLTESERKLEDVEAGGPAPRDIQRAARAEKVRQMAEQGLSDRAIGEQIGVSTTTVQSIRSALGIRPAHDARGGARGRSQIERQRAEPGDRGRGNFAARLSAVERDLRAAVALCHRRETSERIARVEELRAQCVALRKGGEF